MVKTVKDVAKKATRHFTSTRRGRRFNTRGIPKTGSSAPSGVRQITGSTGALPNLKALVHGHLLGD